MGSRSGPAWPRLAGTHPDQIAGVVLFAPYNRLADAAQYDYPMLPVDLLPWIVPLGRLSAQLSRSGRLLVAGQDQVVPEKFGRRLYDGYAGPKRLWEFTGDDHGTIMFRLPNVWKQIIAFWQTNS